MEAWFVVENCVFSLVGLNTSRWPQKGLEVVGEMPCEVLSLESTWLYTNVVSSDQLKDDAIPCLCLVCLSLWEFRQSKMQTWDWEWTF